MQMITHRLLIALMLMLGLSVSAIAGEMPGRPLPPQPGKQAPPAGPQIGEKAPPVNAEWAHGKGLNPAAPDGKHIYVVEFWATWCKPCKQTIPLLNKLHETYKDKNVVIMGITREGTEKVAPFMKESPMSYNVGLDKNEGTHKFYMPDVNQGIPFAYIVDAKGIIVWKGHPLQGLDDVLAKVVAGTWTAETAKAEAKVQEQLMAAMQALQQSRSAEDALKNVERIIALKPDSPRGYGIKLDILRQMQKPEMFPPVWQAWLKNAGHDPDGLAFLSSHIISQPNPSLRDPALALKVAKQAFAIGKNKTQGPALALANMQAALGLLDDAIATLSQALGAGLDSEGIRATIDYYQKLKKLRDETAGK